MLVLNKQLRNIKHIIYQPLPFTSEKYLSLLFLLFIDRHQDAGGLRKAEEARQGKFTTTKDAHNFRV